MILETVPFFDWLTALDGGDRYVDVAEKSVIGRVTVN